MKNFKNIATSATIAAFVVIAVSGVMLYLHFGENYVKHLHEYIGLVFVFVGILHVAANWSLAKKYFEKRVFYILGACVIAFSGFFIAEGFSQKGVNPKSYIISSVINQPLDKVVQFFGIDESHAQEILSKSGYKIDMSKTVTSNAKANKTSPFALMAKFAK